MPSRMILRQLAPHTIRNNDDQGDANRENIPCGGYRKNPHQRIHGVHGGMEDRHGQNTPFGSVINQAEQNGDKWNVF